MTKAELQAEAEKRGIKLTGDEKVADLEKLIADDQSEKDGEPVLKRHRVNRGSRRRIERAINRFNDDIAAFIKEIDVQIYMADADGNRTGEAPLIDGLRRVQEGINEEINGVLTAE